SAASDVETTASSDTWLRALDFTTRVHVAPPPGPLAACPNQTQFPAADSGLPESDVAAADPVTNVDSELELKRSLANAGIDVDPSELDAFSVDARPPFQLSWFEVGSNGASSSALRLLEPGSASELPKIRVAGLDSVPLTLVALARDAVQPATEDAADPSDFAVTYFAVDATSDYGSARAGWRLANADRWLLEVAGSPALFDGALARAATLDSVKDDLAESIRELGVDEIRLSRLFGSLTAAGATFRVASSPRRDPLVVATDFDTTHCAPATISLPPSAMAPRSGATPPGRSPTEPAVDRSGEATTVVADPGDGDGDGDGSGVAVVVDSSDSCGNDPSTPAPGSNEACSGDSSSSDSSSSDSCSGDSSSDDSKDDSCSGDSNSNGNDSSGCGSDSKSGYDGDTCTGNSATSKSSAALESGGPLAARRPHRVRLSLLTLLAAGLSLPLRRRVK
ncbi:MAG TPA: hypothetical protein VHW01_00375, partial [Polyangiaceae bacterium]|nr:hypothetical protein [Polyangiaceae bacterium]